VCMVRPAVYSRAARWIGRRGRRVIAPFAKRLTEQGARWGEEP
jgi:hypothetical protein